MVFETDVRGESDRMTTRESLRRLLQQQALQFGEFTLASGQKATFYLDCRRVTLDSQGALLIAQEMLERLQADWPDAVGGMAIGADPITAAVITVAAQQGRSLKGFIVRKETKQHGLARQVEGPVVPGDRCVILEDVVTTGGSSLKAIERVREFGLEVQGVLAIVDRLAGGRETFEQAGLAFDALFTINDLLPAG